MPHKAHTYSICLCEEQGTVGEGVVRWVDLAALQRSNPSFGDQLKHLICFLSVTHAEIYNKLVASFSSADQ